MKTSLRTLLSGLIDYAGLFPPAKLSLHEAAKGYAEGKRDSLAWLLNSFVLPASKLEEVLEQRRTSFLSPISWQFHVTFQQQESQTVWQENLEIDTKKANQFLGDCQAITPQFKAKILGLEIPLSEEHCRPTTDCDIHSVIEATLKTLQATLPNIKHVYFELPCVKVDSKVREELCKATRSLQKEYPMSLGLKLRMGGLTHEDFPTVEHVAKHIDTCQRFGGPWKATAGLHHAFRQNHPTLPTKIHGFLNLLVAATLAEATSISRSVIEEILADENPDHFQYSDDGISWKDYSASTTTVQTVRETRFQTIGSCSFTEPYHDLKMYGLL